MLVSRKFTEGDLRSLASSAGWQWQVRDLYAISDLLHMLAPYGDMINLPYLRA